MKIGLYDLGTPIEYGFTQENQLYYCNLHGSPSSNNYDVDYGNLFDRYYTITPYSGTEVFSNPVIRRRDYEQYFDTNQQYTSPGSALGAGPRQDAISKPYSTEGVLDCINTVNFPFGGGDNTYLQSFPANHTRFNSRLHSSIFTELLLHNVHTNYEEFLASSTPILYSSALDRITKTLFAGDSLQPIIETDIDSQFNAPRHEFVPAGKPYVKFRFESHFVDDTGITTSGEEKGVVEYFVLMNTFAHFGITQDADVPAEYRQSNGGDGIYTMVTNDGGLPVDSLISFLNSSVTNTFSRTDVNEMKMLFDAVGVSIPTIVADFQDTIFSVDWEDCLFNQPISDIKPFEAFPFPGRYNPTNETNKAPNYGWHPKSNENLTNKSSEELITDYQEYLSYFAYTGNHPYFFTIDNFYLQDYDILGLLPTNVSEFTRYNNYWSGNIGFYQWLADTTIAFENLLLQLESEENNSSTLLERKKIQIILERLNTYSSTDVDDDDLITWITPYLESSAPFSFEDEFSDIAWYLLHDEEGGQYEVEFFLRMFGPIAPRGYQPKCGVNYKQYFNLPDSIDIGPDGHAENYTGGEGVVPFIFNGGLNVGSTETVDTYLGYDASQLLTNYDVAQNISPYAAINLFDLELWKLFYDAQNYNVRIESFIHNEYTSGGQLEPFQTIDIPSPPLNPIINGDGYQTYRTDETRFATLEGSGDYTPIQWPFEDLPVNGLNPNGPSFSGLSPFNETVHPSLAVLYGGLFPNSSHAYSWSNNSIQNAGGTINTPDLTEWTAAALGNPDWRIYRVRKITMYDDDWINRFENCNPFGQYQINTETIINQDGTTQDVQYFWYVEGYVTAQGVYPSNSPEEAFYTYPSINYFRDQFPGYGNNQNNNNFNPGESNQNAPTLQQGEFYVFTHANVPGITNTTNSEPNYVALEPTTFSSDVIMNTAVVNEAYNVGYYYNTYTPRPDSSFALYGRHPVEYNLDFVRDNSILSPIEYEKYEFVHKVSTALSVFSGQWNSFPLWHHYHHIVRFFSSETEFNIPNLLPDGINPHLFDGVNPFNNNLGGFKTTIRDYLRQLSFSDGGIATWEVYNWTQWLKGGCTGVFSNTPPNLHNNYNNNDYTDAFGAFVAPPTQVIGNLNIDNETASSTITFNTTSPGPTWWDICNYLNTFPELKTTAISYIAANEGDSDTILYSSQPIQTDGAIIQAGYYPSNPETPLPTTFFQPGGSLFIKFGGSAFIETAAFGPPPESQGYASGTSFLSMINELIQDGIEGTTIDIYPEDTNGNGQYQNADGRIYLERSIIAGNPDYRPLQLISYAMQNNLMGALNYFLPPSSSPLVADDTPSINTTDYGPTLLPTTINALGIFDGKNSGVKISSDNNYENFTNIHNYDSGRGLLPGTGGSGMNTPSLQDNGYQPKNNFGVFGQNIFTQSTNPTNHPYYFTITNEEPNKASSLEIFDVSWGHIDGSGSLKKGHTKSPSEAIYRQAANELLGTGSAFYSVSQSLLIDGQIITDADQPQYMRGSKPSPDKYVWVLRTKGQVQQGTDLNKKFYLNIKGKNSSNGDVTLQLHSGRQTAGTSANLYGYKSQTNGLRRYYLYRLDSDSRYTATLGCYGYFYPQIGTVVLNPKAAEIFDGTGATTVTEFNGAGAAHNGLLPNGINKSDKEYNNALKLVNVLRNQTGDENSISTIVPAIHTKKQLINYSSDLQTNSQPQQTITAVIRLRPTEFNFTTNKTRLVDLGEHNGEFNTFTANGTYSAVTPAGRETMKYNESLGTYPTTYITHIDLYDRYGYRVATAKLSTPIKKDFNSSVVIKIHINSY
tara:strand:+ start:4573 stop:9996 length:5424 start_codon:yes stop_codon:yes gene_type:complete